MNYVGDTTGKSWWLSDDTKIMYSNCKALTKETNLELFKKWHDEDDESAREKIILGNIKFVIKIASKYISLDSAISPDDLLQIGIVGLIKAVDTFDYRKGYSFTTYASRVISTTLNMLWRRFKYLPLIMSLEEPVTSDKDGNSLSLSDMIVDESIDLENDVIMRIMETLIEPELDYLTELEGSILIDRFGLFGHKPLSQVECGEKYKFSQSYICRITQKAIEKMRIRLLSTV